MADITSPTASPFVNVAGTAKFFAFTKSGSVGLIKTGAPKSIKFGLKVGLRVGFEVGLKVDFEVGFEVGSRVSEKTPTRRNPRNAASSLVTRNIFKIQALMFVWWCTQTFARI